MYDIMSKIYLQAAESKLHNFPLPNGVSVQDQIAKVWDFCSQDEVC